MPGKTNAIRLDEPALQAIEELYRITLSAHERMLLTTMKALLGPLEGQEKFLLTKDLEPIQCPACLRTICRRSTAPWATDGFNYNDTTHGDDDYQCPLCGVRLHYYLLITGSQGFTIHPDEARPVTS